MAFRISSPTRPRLEPLDGDSEFQRRFNAYESEYGDADEGEKQMDAELDCLLGLFEALKQETFITPGALRAMLKLFTKKKFGLQKKNPEDRRLLRHSTLLSMFALSKRVRDNDADGVASLYEFMLDQFFVDGSVHWKELCPHGSLLFAFALFLRQIERTQEAFHSSIVAILKSRQADVVEFEMDDTLSDVMLEKGRHLGGLTLFATFVVPAATSSIFNLNDDVWRASPNSSLPPFLSYTPDVKRDHLLQEAGYAFFSGFVEEFGLIDVQKSDQELLAVVDIFTALFHQHPKLCGAAFDDVMQICEPLSLLFPWKFLHIIKLLAGICSSETAERVLKYLQQSTYTQLAPSDVHYNSEKSPAVVCTEDFTYAQDQFHIRSGTSGQAITIDGHSIICWHVGSYSLWDVLLVRLQATNFQDLHSIENTTAILHLIASIGRHIALSSFENAWKKIFYGQSNSGVGSFILYVANLLAHPDAPLPLQIAAVHVVAIFDGKSISTHFDPATMLLPAMNSIVHKHDPTGILACLEIWIKVAPHSSLAPYLPMVLHIIHYDTSINQWGSILAVRAYRILSHCLANDLLYKELAPTLMDHAKPLLFEAATILLKKRTTSKDKKGDSSKQTIKKFDFNRPTPTAQPFLPYQFESNNGEIDVVFVEAVLHTIHRLITAPLEDRAVLVKWLYKDKTAPCLPKTLPEFVEYGVEPLNWPMACAAYITFPSSPSIRLLAIQILTAVALSLKTSTLMACFRTPDDTRAFLKSLMKILRTDTESADLQSSVWYFLTVAVNAQPSVLSLLFEKDLEAAPCLVDGLRDAYELGRWNVLANALNFFADIWDGLSHSNASHHMATLFRSLSNFWPIFTQPLGEALETTNSPRDTSFAQGAIFKVLAIEYHLQRQELTPTMPVFMDILRSFRDLYDQWFQDYTNLSPDEETETTPLHVLACSDETGLYALEQWTTFMEIYFLEPLASTTDPTSPSANSTKSRSRVTCDSPMLPSRATQERKSNFSGDRTSLEWSLRLAEQMVQEGASGNLKHVQALSSLCLCMIHHQVFEVVHKANDPRWSTTQLRPSVLDWSTSTHLLTLLQSVVYHIHTRHNRNEDMSATTVHLWTATLLLLRHTSQLESSEFSSLLLSRLIVQSVEALAHEKTFDVSLMVLQEVLAQTAPKSNVTTPPPPSTFQTLAILSQSRLIPQLFSSWDASTRTSGSLRCFLTLLSTTGATVIQEFAADVIIREGFLDRGKILARKLTSKATTARDVESQNAWCLLLQVAASLLKLGQVDPVMEFIAYVDPVLQAAYYSNELTESLLKERFEITKLVLEASKYLKEWQHIMPSTFCRLLESVRSHLVPCSFWLQENKHSSDIRALLWKVVHASTVVLIKLTPSTRPEIQIGKEIIVDMEAARPIVDYLPFSSANASVPCSLGHVVRLLKSSLKSPEESESNQKDGCSEEIIDALLILLVSNYILHENRYNHPSNRRLEIQKSIVELLGMAKTSRNDVAFILTLESAVQMIQVPQ